MLLVNHLTTTIDTSSPPQFKPKPAPFPFFAFYMQLASVFFE